MTNNSIKIKEMLKFEIKGYKAVFLEVDLNREERKYFTTEQKAINWLTEIAKKHDIDNIPWNTSRSGQYFNYQFRGHPAQGNSCYYGAVEEIYLE